MPPTRVASDQIELHKQIRRRVNQREKTTVKPNPDLLVHRQRVDLALESVRPIYRQKQVAEFLRRERIASDKKSPVPPPDWLIRIADQLQVSKDSPTDDVNANAVRAIKLLLKRTTGTNERKLAAIRKIIGDIDGKAEIKVT